MNNKFSHKFEEAQPVEILQMLKDSFGTLDNVERHKTSCDIFNARMKKVQKKSAKVSKPRQSKKIKADKSKVECFFCKKLSHWKQNCLAYIATLDPNKPKKKMQQVIAA